MDLAQARTEQWQLGEWYLDAPSRQLIVNDNPISITAKMQDVLLVLLIHSGRPVTKEKIYQLVWPDVMVSEQLIARAISDLRKVFSDDPKNPKYIETLPKAGYRWLAEAAVKNETAKNHELAANSNKTSKFNPWLTGFLVSVFIVVAYLGFKGNDTLQTASPDTSIKFSEASPVTSEAGIENAPTISPDGSTLAYVYTAPERDVSQIVLSRLGNQQLLAKVPFNRATVLKQFAPRFSPDGEKLAFTQYSQQLQTCEVYWLQLNKMAEQFKVGDCSNRFMMSLDWSSDSKQLFFTQDITPQKRALVMADLHQGNTRQISFPLLDGTTDYSPRVSPDGKRLLFVRGQLKPSHHSAVFVLALDGKADGKTDRKADIKSQIKAQQLTKLKQQNNVFGIAWFNSDSVIYSLDREADQALRLLSLKNGSDSLIGQGSYRRIDYHRDTAVLVHAKSQSVRNIVSLSLRAEGSSAQTFTPTPLITSTRNESLPKVSPNGELIAFSADRTGSDQLWLADLDGSNQRQLTNLPKSGITNISWSPDASKILLAVQVDLLTQFYTFDLNENKLKRQATGEHTLEGVRWSKHPEWLIASCQIEQVWQICRISIIGDRFEILTKATGYSPYSPVFSDFVYFTRQGQGLWRLPLFGGEAELVWQEFPEHSWKNWMLFENQLYFIGGDNSQTNLIKQDLISGESQVIFKGNVDWSKTSFDINPNGEALYLSIQAPASDDIYKQTLVLP